VAVPRSVGAGQKDAGGRADIGSVSVIAAGPAAGVLYAKGLPVQAKEHTAAGSQ